MGTNYYIQHKTTDTEKETLLKYHAKIPRLHIGKSSGGWSFSFHAIYPYEAEDFGLPYSEIICYAGWLKVLEQINTYEIVDEYGTFSSLEDFKSMVEDKRDGLNHTTQCSSSSDLTTRRHALENCFVDEQGNSFTKGDFS